MMTGWKKMAASYTCIKMKQYKKYNPLHKPLYFLKAMKWNMK